MAALGGFLRVGAPSRRLIRALSVQRPPGASWKSVGVFSAANPGDMDGKQGTHVPRVSFEGDVARVSTQHGQDPDHFIQRLWIETMAGRVLGGEELPPSGVTAASKIKIPEAVVGPLTAFASCNLHKVWKSTPVFYTGPVHSQESPGPWEGKQAKHVPTLVIKGGVAKVSTEHGQEEDHHLTVHWVEDAKGIRMGPRVLPHVGASAVSELPIPTGATAPFTAYSHCNLHGTWKSAPVSPS